MGSYFDVEFILWGVGLNMVEDIQNYYCVYFVQEKHFAK